MASVHSRLRVAVCAKIPPHNSKSLHIDENPFHHGCSSKSQEKSFAIYFSCGLDINSVTFPQRQNWRWNRMFLLLCLLFGRRETSAGNKAKIEFECFAHARISSHSIYYFVCIAIAESYYHLPTYAKAAVCFPRHPVLYILSIA